LAPSQKATKGVFITTSEFSSDARAFVTQVDSRIVLIDGELLTKLMVEHGLGVTTTGSYDVKRIDSDYFSEE
jgi:restriction system protein